MTAEQFKQQTEFDRSSSFWLKKALVTAEGRDVIDALADAEKLLKYCQLRAAQTGLGVA